MKTKIIKLVNSFDYEGYSDNDQVKMRVTPEYSWVNVDTIKSIQERHNAKGSVVNYKNRGWDYDDRTPDELMDYINNL